MKKCSRSVCVIITVVFLLGAIFSWAPAEASFAAETQNVPTVSSLTASNVKGAAITLKWKKVQGASGYLIYQKNNKSGKYKKIKTIKKGSAVKWTHRKLKKNKTYTYRIVTTKKIKGKTKKSAKSFWVSAITATKASKKANVKKVAAKKNSYTVTVGKKVTVKASLSTGGKGKAVSTKKRWTSSNKKIATVDKNGKVTGKNAGNCLIYCKAHNGKTAKIKLTVKTPYAEKIPVLTFHRIVSEKVKKNYFPDDQWVASVEDFKMQMNYLHMQGYKTISLDEFYDWYMKKNELPKKTVVITFDDGYYELYHLALPVLKQYGFKAAAFVIGAKTEETTAEYQEIPKDYRIGKDLIEKVAVEYPALEFQSHSWDLHQRDADGNPIAYSRSLTELAEDFRREKEIFSYDYMAYPYGACPSSMVQAFKGSGMKMAFGFGKYRPATRDDDIFDVYRVKINGQISFDKYKSILEKALK